MDNINNIDPEKKVPAEEVAREESGFDTGSPAASMDTVMDEPMEEAPEQVTDSEKDSEANEEVEAVKSNETPAEEAPKTDDTKTPPYMYTP